MRCFLYLVLLPLIYVVESNPARSIGNGSLALPASNTISPVERLTKEDRRERRKERRILRKKKQRMRELREEIRILSHSLQHNNSSAVHDKADVRQKQKARQGRKGVKWRRNLLEKLKGIMKRLDRMERRLVEGNQIIHPEVTALFYETSNASSTTAVSPSINKTLNNKLKRIQPAINRSRSGENGAPCSAHKDCRPGHCCHQQASKDGSKRICVLHRLPEKAGCLDGCQCATQLNCFLSDGGLVGNMTSASCKRAASSDILTGSYLYKQDSVLDDSNL
ncbi:hypothetical protein Q1695_012424 [Nippostrongylus brasiliensis]|nr:hypothetical protein Q1695_012424 [Nippostrongylus brasiliensis]